MWASGSVVVKELCYKPEGRGFGTRSGEIFNLPNLSCRTRPWGSPSNRNEYQKQKKLCFWGVERGRCVGLISIPPSVSRLCRQCGILNISQSYRPPRPVTVIVFFLSKRPLLGRRHPQKILPALSVHG
jgi:hypothetical protein